VKRLHVIIGLLWCFAVSAAEIIPPAPKLYFNDYAGVVSSATADRLNRTLEDFEKQTSSQIWVVVYPKMESDSSIDDYAVRVARAWRVGQQGKNNGTVLFVFVQDRKMSIQAGYGMEGVLPDALCIRIINDEIAPRFKSGDYDGGLSAGVAAMLAATRGEYKGTGRTAYENRGDGRRSSLHTIWVIFVIVLVILSFIGRRSRFGGGWIISSGGFGGWGGGGGWSGGGGGGGGFSGGGGNALGGGGSFGGGGASGSW
jgi:uncharacterized protein